MAKAIDPIKVYDARWEVGEFDDAAVSRMFEATLLYARGLKVDTLTFTRDSRLGCAAVMKLGIDTALRMGFRVYANLAPVSTPQSYFTTHHVTSIHPGTMGLAVTASHNPAQYVGVKFTVPTVAAIGQDCGPLNGLTRVREIFHSPEPADARPGGQLHLVSLDREYVDYSLETAGVKPGSLAGLKVVLDTFNGSAGPELYTALSRAGATVFPLRLIPDGQFPTGSPNPTSQGKMSAAIELAREVGAHAVIGVDGDGDRLVFGDSRGILTAGFAFVPILRSCLAGEPVGVPALYDPKVSPLALAEWGGLGAKPVLFRNGHSQIKDYMTRVSALAAAEESGHYYHRLTYRGLTISGENSALTLLLFLAALKSRPTLMNELWAKQDQVFTTGEFNYQFADDATRDAALAALVKLCVSQGATTTTATPDGIDLQGTCLDKGVHLTPGNVRLDPGWFSGYLRVATNEKGVVRSYFSAGETTLGRQLESQARTLLSTTFPGRVVE
jgi:phosphomannomutase